MNADYLTNFVQIHRIQIQLAVLYVCMGVQYVFQCLSICDRQLTSTSREQKLYMMSVMSVYS